MKTVMKKLLSVMLVALLLVSAVPFQASAAEAITPPTGHYVEVAVRREGGNSLGTAVYEQATSMTLSEALSCYAGYDPATMEVARWEMGDGVTMTAISGTSVQIQEDCVIEVILKDKEATTPETPEVPEQGGNQSGNQGGESKPIVGGGEAQPEDVVTKCELTIDYKLSGYAVSTVNAQIGKLYKEYVGVPARGGYDFLGWYSSHYGRIIDVTKDILMGDDSLTGMWSAAKEFNLTLDENRGAEETVNYGVKVTYGENIYAKVSKYQPEREGYVFMGWKLNGKMITKDTVYDLYDDATAYAVWKLESDTEDEPMNGGAHTKDGKVYLEIYVNGDTSAPEKKVDITDYAADSKITRAEVEKVVAKYVTAKAGYKLAYEGLFNEETWWWYTRDPETDGKDSIIVNQDGDDYVYVMVNNVKVVAADPSNPKTGDGIVIALATMMSTGGAALALGKKKFF